MIKIIFGGKGSGKTKQIIDKANDAVKKAKGNIVFISDTNRYMYEIHRDIRFVNTNEYYAKCLTAFVSGLIAGNSDIEIIFIDGIARICGSSIDNMQKLFDEFEAMAVKYNVNFVITISCDEANLPEFICKFK